jgi:mannose-6-phosphate isomerase
MALYPLTFEPIPKERVWGGRNLERLYQKPLPPDVPIGESWEISDHGENISRINNGPLAGKNLRWLMEHHRDELLGPARLQSGRFPLLIKILDAEDKLSLQVHPPADRAAELKGEPKTEMWYIAQAAPGAELYVGLKRGVTPPEFERKIQSGQVADCFHRVRVKAGDAMFLPSGRVHAIGAGLVLFEVQQNSDTTYRVFDWNRVGLDGKPRALHIRESLASIDFNDFEPGLIRGPARSANGKSSRLLVQDPLFTVWLHDFEPNAGELFGGNEMRILGGLSGEFEIEGGGVGVDLKPGSFCLLPAALEGARLRAKSQGRLLEIKAGL